MCSQEEYINVKEENTLI